MPARFGPLGHRGGERRLNVAISRAKSECFIVSSFDPKLLHVGKSKHDGPKLFKGFLTFAHHMSEGRISQANQVLDDVRGTASVSQKQQRTQHQMVGYLSIASQIALAVEALGDKASLNVGTSGFRIPLVVHKTDMSASLAIMTWEGEPQENLQSASFSHFVHEPAVLALRQWQVMHVSPASWLRRPSDVLREIQDRLSSLSKN